jgi:large subunit ribosomal protein L31e
MKLERVYTVPLGKAIEAVRYKRTPRAVKILRAFISRHMKQEDERITISAALNEHLWQRSIKKPPRKVKVRLIKDAGFIRAYLSDEKIVEPKKAEEKKEEAKPAEKKEEPKKEAPKPAAAKPAAPAHQGEKK